MDLTTTDEMGRLWDFECVHMRNKAARKLLTDKPELLIGSPMCIEFSSWMNLNHAKMARGGTIEIAHGKITLRILYKTICIANQPRTLLFARTPTKCDVLARGMHRNDFGTKRCDLCNC